MLKQGFEKLNEYEKKRKGMRSTSKVPLFPMFNSDC
jgi:hypothetical protein